MAVYQAGLERKQAFLFRAVEIAIELFAITAAVGRAQRLVDSRDPNAEKAVELADAFARGAERRIDGWFKAMWSNDDDLNSKIGRSLLTDRHVWIEHKPWNEA
jgi:hypothetical protein